MIVRPSFLNEYKTVYYVRYIYDLTNFLIVNMLGLNLIFSIIIQNFAQMREELNQRQLDNENVCFICSLPRPEIEKTLEGFDYHVQEDHNIWNYLYFMYYLKKKPSDFTGVESAISHKILKDDHSWFPIGRCLKLNDEDDESLKSKIDKLRSKIDLIIAEQIESSTK